MKKQWYEAKVLRAHLSTSKYCKIKVYIFAKDITEVLGVIKVLPGTKKSLLSPIFPDVKKLSEQESINLEKKILNERRISIGRAKREWYYCQTL